MPPERALSTEPVLSSDLTDDLLAAINRTYRRQAASVSLGRPWMAVALALRSVSPAPDGAAYAFYGMAASRAGAGSVPAYVIAVDTRLIVMVTSDWSSETHGLPERFEVTQVPFASVTEFIVHRGLFLDRVVISFRDPQSKSPRRILLGRVAHRPDLRDLEALIRNGS